MKNPVLLGAMSVPEWLSYRSADGCVGLAPGIVDGIRRRAPRQRIALVPNASDLDVFRPGERAALKLPGIGEKDLVALFTGAHGIANGLDAVLDAAAELKRRGRADIKLVFIGDGREKPALKARAAREDLTNCVFVDLIKKTELAKMLGAADVGLMILANVPAFYYGTSPNKFFDYIAAGLPVLNNYPGWLAGLIGQHDCGVVVRPDEPGELADALCRLADDPEGRKRMGRNARGLAEREFNREMLAARFCAFLEECALGRMSIPEVGEVLHESRR